MSDAHGLWENRSGRGGGGEKCVMCMCGRRLGATGSPQQDWPRAGKRDFSNAYPQTPAPLSNLHFLPRPPTDTLHLLEEKFKCCTAMASSDIQAFENQKNQKFVWLLFSVHSRTNWIFDQNKWERAGLGSQEFSFHLVKLDSQQNLNVLHNILAKRS